MFDEVRRNPTKVGWKRRVGMTVVGGAMAVGLAVGTALPAHAVATWDVSSSWTQAKAWAYSSTGGDGYYQAYAYLGNTTSWGAYSAYASSAEVNGFDFTHNAHVYRNGSLIASAQS